MYGIDIEWAKCIYSADNDTNETQIVSVSE